MADLVFDRSRMAALADAGRNFPAPDRLYRDGSVFFVGGELPVYETLATMFDSFCMEATSLFFLVVGHRECYSQGVEMARQIKKNFNARLMAGLEPAVDAATLERMYASGVDNLIISIDGSSPSPALPESFASARSIFPRWGVAAILHLDEASPEGARQRIDLLLREGIVPLVRFSGRPGGMPPAEAEALFKYLVAGWEKYPVPLSTYLPLVTVMTPLVETRPAGFFRGLVGRIRDRRQLAESDLRRHLRVQHVEDSLDSAGL